MLLKNRILYVCLSEKINGTEKHVLNLIETIKENDKYCIFIVTYNGELADKCDDLGVNVIRIRKGLIFYELAKTIVNVKPVILHAHLGRSGLYGRILGFFFRVPIIIYTEHAWAQENYELFIFSRMLHTFFYRMLSKFTNKIIAVSPSVYNYLSKNVEINDERLILINNGVEKVNVVEKEKNNIVRFGYIGRLEKEKNLLCLLKAVELLKEECFIVKIIGDGSQEQFLKKYCKKRNIDGKVNFYGYIDSSEIGNVYKKIDVVILPSLRETFGLVLAEGMMNECPCIGSNIGGIKYIIDNGFNGYLFKSDDHYDLAKKMKTYINDPSKIMKHGINARKKALEEYCINRMVIEVEKVYDEELKKYIK